MTCRFDEYDPFDRIHSCAIDKLADDRKFEMNCKDWKEKNSAEADAD
jgi:hypothetical protein